jgi:ubiquinone/menaquinone biosynthesis C-methylase UbiE
VTSPRYTTRRALLPATARLWQELIADYIDPGAAPLILDLGCGTGRFSELLAQWFGGQVIGIDPSERMLQQARRKPNPGNISYGIASAEARPLLDDGADLVFMSMVYHHLGNPADAAREYHRVLRDGGYVCIRNGTGESDFPHRHFFALQPLIDTELPARAEIAATFESAGFAPVTHQVVRQRRSLPTGPALSRSRSCAAPRFLRAIRQRISHRHDRATGIRRQDRCVRSRHRRDRLVCFHSARVARRISCWAVSLVTRLTPESEMKVNGRCYCGHIRLYDRHVGAERATR